MWETTVSGNRGALAGTFIQHRGCDSEAVYGVRESKGVKGRFRNPESRSKRLRVFRRNRRGSGLLPGFLTAPPGNLFESEKQPRTCVEEQAYPAHTMARGREHRRSQRMNCGLNSGPIFAAHRSRADRRIHFPVVEKGLFPLPVLSVKVADSGSCEVTTGQLFSELRSEPQHPVCIAMWRVSREM
jgi:hypothetical protein